MLVEGLFDVHQLCARGVENIAALGGTAIRAQTFERLGRLGFERVTLCLDRDESGRAATARAIEQAASAGQSPAIRVIDPEALAPAKDPDALVREHGLDAWLEVLSKGECGVTWRACEFLEGVNLEADRTIRRDALSRAGAWLGRLAPRLALEQEDAVRAVAERSGYSPAAVERAFRARYWRQAPDTEVTPERRAVAGLVPEL